jgi:hypothetical protein
MLSRELLFSYANQSPLFGDRPLIVLENALSVSDVVFDAELLALLKDSLTSFVFMEDALTAAEIKKYKPYAEDIVKFDREEAPRAAANPFVIANAFEKRDKIGAWSAYCASVERGGEPEAIAGMLFWKIKTLLLAGTSRVFTVRELQLASSKLIDLYHAGHSGQRDMSIGLEQFLLTVLS